MIPHDGSSISISSENSSTSGSGSSSLSHNSSESKNPMKMVLRELMSLKKQTKNNHRKLQLELYKQAQQHKIEAEEHKRAQKELQEQGKERETVLLAHIASHKRELQLAEERAEERGAAQITDLKLHHKNLMSQILLNRKVNDHTDTDTDTNTVSTSEDLTSNQINNQNSINTAGWKKVAEGLVEFRSNNHKSNEFHVKRIFAENAAFLAPILAICPNVKCLLANVLTNAVSRNTKKARVSPGSEASRLKNLTEAEGELCGKREFAKQIYQN